MRSTIPSKNRAMAFGIGLTPIGGLWSGWYRVCRGAQARPRRTSWGLSRYSCRITLMVKGLHIIRNELHLEPEGLEPPRASDTPKSGDRSDPGNRVTHGPVCIRNGAICGYLAGFFSRASRAAPVDQARLCAAKN